MDATPHVDLSGTFPGDIFATYGNVSTVRLSFTQTSRQLNETVTYSQVPHTTRYVLDFEKSSDVVMTMHMQDSFRGNSAPTVR